MNRATAVQKASEMFPAKGWVDALHKAYQIPGEPVYRHVCMQCEREVDPLEYCCGECEQEERAECPMCGDDIEWSTDSVPRCVHCDWEGDQQ